MKLWARQCPKGVDSRNLSPHGLRLRSPTNFVLIEVWSMKTNGTEQIGLRQPTVCAPVDKFHKIPYANWTCRTSLEGSRPSSLDMSFFSRRCGWGVAGDDGVIDEPDGNRPGSCAEGSAGGADSNWRSGTAPWRELTPGLSAVAGLSRWRPGGAGLQEARQGEQLPLPGSDAGHRVDQGQLP